MIFRRMLILAVFVNPLPALAQTDSPFVSPDMSYEQRQAETISHNGVTVTYIDRGVGPTVLPFMYTGGGFAYWQSFIDAAKQQHRVLSPDGRSYSLPQLQALIEYTNSGPVDLLTHSAAAWLAIHFAARHPDLINSLILFEPAYAPDLASASRSALVFENSCDLADQPPDVMSLCRIVNGMTGAGYFERMPEAYLAAVTHPDNNLRMAEVTRQSDLPVAGPDLLEKGWVYPLAPICTTSASLTVPILVVRGAVSTQSSRIALDAHEACLPPHQSVVIERGTHFAHFERPDEFNSAVLAFISEQRN